jgi:hypothetical protein
MAHGHEGLSDEDLENLNKLFDLNATHASQRLTDLAAKWGVGGLRNELDVLLKGLRDGDRPETAVVLDRALTAFLNDYGPEGVVGQADTYRDHA